LQKKNNLREERKKIRRRKNKFGNRKKKIRRRENSISKIEIIGGTRKNSKGKGFTYETRKR